MSNNSLGQPILNLVSAGTDETDNPMFVAHLENLLVRLRPNGGLGSFGTLGELSVPEIVVISSGTSDDRASTSWVVFSERNVSDYNLCVWVGATVVKIQLDSKPKAICHDHMGYIFVAEAEKISIFKYDKNSRQLRRISKNNLDLTAAELWLTFINGMRTLYARTADGECLEMNCILSQPGYVELTLDKVIPIKAFQHLGCRFGETYFLHYHTQKLHVFQRQGQQDTKYDVDSSMKKIIHWRDGLILLFQDGKVAIINDNRGLGAIEQWRWIENPPYENVASWSNVLALTQDTKVIFKYPDLASTRS